MEVASAESAFPRLSHEEMDLVRSIGAERHCRDGEIVLRAGDADIDFYVVKSGQVEILNPTAADARVTVHQPGEFIGDIDLLTRRPVIVTAVARGPRTVLLRIPGGELRRLLNAVPRLGEKLIMAFAVRRVLLQRAGVLGLKVIGEGHSAETTQLREFFHKNFVPHTFYDVEAEEGRRELRELGKRPDQTPVVECGDGRVLTRPSLAEVARCAGLRRECPETVFDLAIVGAGPAGMAAAVYAASEALSTIVLDRLGPGGQAAGSSMIENFIGFPSGLTGAELATRGVLQMLKFGALLLTPVRAERLVAAPGPGQPHTVVSDDGTEVRARCVLVATGARWRRLEAKGAARFDRAGIYYAATPVEARVCTGLPVAVVGGGNSAGQAAMFLSECSPAVHMLIRGPDLAKGMSDYLHSRIRQNDRIRIHTDVEVEAVVRGEQVRAVEVVDKKHGGRQRIDVGGVFVFIGAEPYTQWLPEEVARDDHGYVLTGPDAHRSPKWKLNREPCQLETTLPGVLAAGDVRAGSTKRVGFAVGDGSMAVTCVHKLRAL